MCPDLANFPSAAGLKPFQATLNNNLLTSCQKCQPPNPPHTQPEYAMRKISGHESWSRHFLDNALRGDVKKGVGTAWGGGMGSDHNFWSKTTTFCFSSIRSTSLQILKKHNKTFKLSVLPYLGIFKDRLSS